MRRNQAIGITLHLHPHLSVLNIVFHRIQNLLRIGDSQNLEFHIPEVDGIEGVVLPGNDDGAFVDWGADFGSVSSSVSGAGPSVKHYFRITFLRGNSNTLIINDLYFAS